MGEATFEWSGSDPAGGTETGTTGTDVALDEGGTVSFANRTYRVGENWELRVRPDLQMPSDPAVADQPASFFRLQVRP